MPVFEWGQRPSTHFGDIWVPFVHVRLPTSSNSHQSFVLQIDSGAVVSLLRRSVAELLGIELESGRRVSLGGVGGAQTTAYLHTLSTEFGDQFEFDVPFAIADSEVVPNLLGRLGVFDRLQIDFDASLKETRLSAPWLDEEGALIWRHLLDLCRYIEERFDQLNVGEVARQAIVQMYNHASRLVASVAGLAKLHRHPESSILIRALFEVAAQFEYLMQDPEIRGKTFIEFGHVSRYLQQIDFVKNACGPVSDGVANSPLRAEGEKRLKAEFDKYEKQFRTKKGHQKYWYRFSTRGLAEKIGWLSEYDLWYRSFSNHVHFNPFLAIAPNHRREGSTELFLCYHYFGRMLKRIADFGGIILTSEQHETLRTLSKDFT